MCCNGEFKADQRKMVTFLIEQIKVTLVKVETTCFLHYRFVIKIILEFPPKKQLINSSPLKLMYF